MISIEISNRIYVRGEPTKELRKLVDELVEMLTMPNPKFEEAISQGRRTYGIDALIQNYELLRNGIAIPRGCRHRLMSMINNLNAEYKIIDNRTKFDHIHVDSKSIKYRSYQAKPVMDLVTKGDEGVLVAPAGSGKTIMGLSLVPLLGQPTIWLTHRDRLLKQVLDRTKEFLPSLTDEDKGVIGGGKISPGNVLTVGMIQTLTRFKKEDFKKISDLFGTLILDEAHHCPANTFLKVVLQFSAYYIYGLTATPYRRDKLENVMFQSLGEANAVIPREIVVKEGGIITPIVKYRAILSKKVDDDNNTARILRNHIIDNEDRNNVIVSDVVREALAGNICLVLSDRKIHCKTLYDLISIAYKKVGIATGNFKKKHIDEQVRLLESGEITVLVCTSDLLAEGFDVDILNRGFITIPFRSETKTEQVVGRMQRTATGKVDAIIYDYVDVNIGVLASQFYSRVRNDCRYKKYEELGCVVEPIKNT